MNTRDEKKVKMALDIFRELGNIGTGSAVTALSNITRAAIDETLPQVFQLDSVRLMHMVGKDDEKAYGFLFPIGGEISGMLLLLLQTEFVDNVLKLINRGGGWNPEEEQICVVQEIANIMTSSYFNAVASYSGKLLEIYEPAVSCDMIGAIVTDPASLVSRDGGSPVCVESSFSMRDSDASGHLCFMIYQDSIEQFFQSLGVNL